VETRRPNDPDSLHGLGGLSETEAHMMNGMMDRMMGGMGLVSILVIVVLVLATAALLKYLFSR
jgi:hypothetical protein